MNTSQFTYRDFVTYFLSGILLVGSVSIVYRYEVNAFTKSFFENKSIISDFSFIVSVSALLIIYLLGHIVHWFDYLIMKIYIWIYRLNQRFTYKPIYWFRKAYESLLYKHRVAYHIAIFIKNNDSSKFKTNNEFWVKCSVLQVNSIFSNCEYWYSLNDLFKGSYFTCIFILILSISEGDTTLAIISFLLGFVFYWRARQFAEYFVASVNRNLIAKQDK